MNYEANLLQREKENTAYTRIVRKSHMKAETSEDS